MALTRSIAPALVASIRAVKPVFWDITHTKYIYQHQSTELGGLHVILCSQCNTFVYEQMVWYLNYMPAISEGWFV